MSFYKDENECRLFKDNYEAAEAYGPGGTYAVKFENIVNPNATGYGGSYEKFEALGDGTYKVTRVSEATSAWYYGMMFTLDSSLTDICKNNHKYYFQIDVYVSRLPSTTTDIAIEGYSNWQWFWVGLPSTTNTWETLSTFKTFTPTGSALKNRILLWHNMKDSEGGQDGDYYMIRKPIFIDLTQSFGEGNEPTTQAELYEALPQLADGGYMTPVATTTLAQTYIPTTHKTSYWIGEDCDVHFNQQVPITAASSTYTTNNGDGSFTCTGNEYYVLTSSFSRVVGHKYLFYCQGGEDGKVYLRVDVTGGGAITTNTQAIVTMLEGPLVNPNLLYIRSYGLTEGESITITPMLFDLTEMFGEGYEPTTVEEFTRMYTDTYYPYTPSLIIPSTSNYNTAYKNRDGVTFNQLFTIPTAASGAVNGITFTNNNDGSVTLNGTVTDAVAYWQLQTTDTSSTNRIIKGHKYLFTSFISGKLYIRFWYTDGTIVEPYGTAIFTATANGWNNGGVYLRVGTVGTTYTDITIWPMLIDLTKIYGYGNEPTTLEEFRKDFPDTYYKYTEGKQTAIRVCDKPIYRGYLNQVYYNSNTWSSSTKRGITVSWDAATQLFTATGTYTTDTGDPNIYIPVNSTTATVVSGHQYYIRFNGGKFTSGYVYLGWTTTGIISSLGGIYTATDVTGQKLTARYDNKCVDGDVVNETFHVEIIDLTALFGEGNEPTEPRICNELFGSNHVAYQTNTAIDSPLNLKAILQEQVTTKLVGYDTNMVSGTEDITVSGTYNDPLICQYVPTETTQATSTGANLIDIGRYCKVTTAGTSSSVNFQHLPDGTFKWTANHNSSEDNVGRFLDALTDKDGNLITATSGQTVRISYVVDEISTNVNPFVSCVMDYSGGAAYMGVFRNDLPVGTRHTVSRTVTNDITQFRLYVESPVTNDSYVIFHDFMFEIDTNVGTYEPYNHAQAGPSPTNPLPVLYNQCQEITINPGITPTITSLEDTPKLIWAPTNYETDFSYILFSEGTRIRKYTGADYVKLIPLVGYGVDTAWSMSVNNISLTAGKMYAFVFKYKRYNCIMPRLAATRITAQDSNDYEYYCLIQDSSGKFYTGTEELETPSLTHLDNPDGNLKTAYDEGWSWYRFTAPKTDTYMIRIGADTPNIWYSDSSKESYLQFTNMGIYEGTFSNPTGNVNAHKTILNNSLERKLITNQQLGNVKQGSTNRVIDTYSPYMDNEGTMQSCKIQKNIIQVFDGSESGWQKGSSYDHTFVLSLSAIDGFEENTTINYGWCSHFEKLANSEIDTKNGIYMYYTWALYVTQMDCTTLAEFKAWLANEAKTNPVVVVAGIANASDYKITYGDPIKANLLPYQSIISHNGTSLTVKAKQYRDTRVPNGYTRLKYLQSNGTQYIDLGFVPTDTYGFRIHAMKLAEEVSLIIGVNNSQTTDDLIGRWGCQSLNTRIGLDWNEILYHGEGGEYLINEEFEATVNYLNDRKTIAKNITTKASQTEIDITTTLQTTQSYNVLMFAANWRSATPQYFATAKVYECEITNGSTIIHHYLPCLDIRNTPCMYDTITGMSYYNSGTGDDFTYEIL